MTEQDTLKHFEYINGRIVHFLYGLKGDNEECEKVAKATASAIQSKINHLYPGEPVGWFALPDEMDSNTSYIYITYAPHLTKHVIHMLRH